MSCYATVEKEDLWTNGREVCGEAGQKRRLKKIEAKKRDGGLNKQHKGVRGRWITEFGAGVRWKERVVPRFFASRLSVGRLLHILFVIVGRSEYAHFK